MSFIISFTYLFCSYLDHVYKAYHSFLHLSCFCSRCADWGVYTFTLLLHTRTYLLIIVLTIILLSLGRCGSQDWLFVYSPLISQFCMIFCKESYMTWCWDVVLSCINLNYPLSVQFTWIWHSFHPSACFFPETVSSTKSVSFRSLAAVTNHSKEHWEGDGGTRIVCFLTCHMCMPHHLVLKMVRSPHPTTTSVA